MRNNFCSSKEEEGMEYDDDDYDDYDDDNRNDLKTAHRTIAEITATMYPLRRRKNIILLFL